LGDEALEMLDNWWEPTSCAAVAAALAESAGSLDG
jgi:hypothetical protein